MAQRRRAYRYIGSIMKNDPTVSGGIVADNWTTYISEIRFGRAPLSYMEKFKDDVVKDYNIERFYFRRPQSGKKILPGMRLTFTDENSASTLVFSILAVDTPNNIRMDFEIIGKEEIDIGAC